MADFFDDIEKQIDDQINQKYKETATNSEDLLKFDKLKMYFGDDYTIGNIRIMQPTIGDILSFGEKRMYASIAPLTGNTTSYRLMLWEAGIDWNKITDYELFLMLYKTMRPEDTSLIFGDFDFTELVPLRNPEDENDKGKLYRLIYDKKGNVIDAELVIDEIIYTQLSEYLRTMFNQHPKNQFAKGKATKQVLIRRDKEALLKNKDKDENSSYLLPLISACVNHPGFKYKKNELREVGIVEFMDSVNRLQVYEQSTAFLKGMYSGFMSTKDMSQEQLNNSVNWLRDI